MASEETTHEGRTANRLADCTSPYLQQHAFNPVDWYPWGEEAIERARREDMPILLSIGYAACHWCHVMERESFEDPEIARLMNENFVNIKVDREERPDLDELYMRAVQLMTGGGGWPLTVFLTPDLVPFYGGTYFPPQNRPGMPGFPAVLRAVRRIYDESREQADTSATRLREAIAKLSTPAPAEGEVSDELLGKAFRQIEAQFDARNGGFGAGAKFPQAPVLEFALRRWRAAGRRGALEMVILTLDRMAAGGIRDQIGGGFHRYTVDPRWHVPHFEKMLYDNAQLIGLYADACRITGNEEYRRAAEDAARYVLSDLRGEEGGLYCSQDADSEGVEGRYYVWTYDEILDCVGREEGELVARYFGATAEGNWEDGLNILERSIPLRGAAGLFGVSEEEAADAVRRGAERLLERRRQRVPPATDTKVLTDWNALAVSGLVRLHRAAPGGPCLEAARRCVAFLEGALWGDGRLMHSWREGRAGAPAFLSDHAFLADALIDLYEATFEVDYLRKARRLVAAMAEDYWDGDAGLFRDVGRANEPLIAPLRSVSDQPLPSGNSTACRVLLRLAALGDGEEHREMAGRVLAASVGLMERAPQGIGAMLSAAQRYLSPSHEFVIVGEQGPAADAFRSVADEFYLPHLARAGAPAGEVEALAAEVPLLEGREDVGGRPTAYLCTGGACQRPAQDPDELRRQMRALVGDA